MAKSFFLGRAKQAVAQASINQQDVRAVPIPLPHLEEQELIAAGVNSVDERLSLELFALQGMKAVKSALMTALLTGELRVTPDEQPA